MPDPRDLLPPPPNEGPPIPAFLLKKYPFLKDTPVDFWMRFWSPKDVPRYEEDDDRQV